MGTGLGIRSLMMAFLQVTTVRCSLMFLFDHLIVRLGLACQHREYIVLLVNSPEDPVGSAKKI